MKKIVAFIFHPDIIKDTISGVYSWITIGLLTLLGIAIWHFLRSYSIRDILYIEVNIWLTLLFIVGYTFLLFRFLRRTNSKAEISTISSEEQEFLNSWVGLTTFKNRVAAFRETKFVNHENETVNLLDCFIRYKRHFINGVSRIYISNDPEHNFIVNEVAPVLVLHNMIEDVVLRYVLTENGKLFLTRYDEYVGRFGRDSLGRNTAKVTKNLTKKTPTE